MNVLFENSFTRDVEWSRDIYRYIYFRRPIAIAMHSIYAFGFILGLISTILIGELNFFIIAAPLLYLIILLIYLSNSRILPRRDIEMHGKPIENKIIVTDECIRSSASTGAELQLRYADVRRIVRTKKFVYLLTRTKVFYSFKVSGFTLGDADGLVAFLKEKVRQEKELRGANK